MTSRDEIYDHLAQVYLGKRKKADAKKQKEFNAWLVINIFITLIIFASAFYGLTAFFTNHSSSLQNKIIYSINNGPLSIEYNLNATFPPVKTFSLTIPPIDATKYKKLEFSIRSKEEGTPGIVKVMLRNKKNETSYYYVQGIDLFWKKLSIPLDEFKQITDWQSLLDISFVLESWNVDDKKGLILVENVCFSS